MLKNVIDFVVSRTKMSREDALREINFAWRETWNSDDLPNSLFEISVTPVDSNARISLPWYVGEVRGVKQNYGYGRTRIELNTPRPYYQDQVYLQSPFTWRNLGSSPLVRSITNATTVNLTFTEPVTKAVTVSLIGPNDNGSNDREQIVFDINDITKTSTKRFTDFNAIAKSVITETDLIVKDSNDVELARIPNLAFEAKNTIWQITDKCFVACNYCRCFDVLYKLPAPYLYFDEQAVPFEEVLMAKTMEWIALPKEGQEQKAVLYGEKAKQLIIQYNANERGIEHKIDLGINKFNTAYVGNL